MKYLFDTNIISELQKSQCNPKVKAFTDNIPAEDMYICALTMGELYFGIEKLPAGKKKHELSIWFFTKLPEWFGERILSLDTEVLIEWGKIRARTKRTMPICDTLIAATAITHHLILVTRNTADFEGVEGLSVLNPWLS